jgi:hypothetical protein
MFMGAEVRLRSTPTKSEDYAILEVEDFDERVENVLKLGSDFISMAPVPLAYLQSPPI